MASACKIWAAMFMGGTNQAPLANRLLSTQVRLPTLTFSIIIY